MGQWFTHLVRNDLVIKIDILRGQTLVANPSPSAIDRDRDDLDTMLQAIIAIGEQKLENLDTAVAALQTAEVVADIVFSMVGPLCPQLWAGYLIFKNVVKASLADNDSIEDLLQRALFSSTRDLVKMRAWINPDSKDAGLLTQLAVDIGEAAIDTWHDIEVEMATTTVDNSIDFKAHILTLIERAATGMAATVISPNIGDGFVDPEDLELFENMLSRGVKQEVERLITDGFTNELQPHLQ